MYRLEAGGGTVTVSRTRPWADDHTAPVDRTIFAINMLINTERGNCYSFNEIKAWLEEAGFESVELVDCFAMPSLILAVKG